MRGEQDGRGAQERVGSWVDGTRVYWQPHSSGITLLRFTTPPPPPPPHTPEDRGIYRRCLVGESNLKKEFSKFRTVLYHIPAEEREREFQLVSSLVDPHSYPRELGHSATMSKAKNFIGMPAPPGYVWPHPPFAIPTAHRRAVVRTTISLTVSENRNLDRLDLCCPPSPHHSG
jgi:hypothetical protein